MKLSEAIRTHTKGKTKIKGFLRTSDCKVCTLGALWTSEEVTRAIDQGFHHWPTAIAQVYPDVIAKVYDERLSMTRELYHVIMDMNDLTEMSFEEIANKVEEMGF